MSKESLHDDRRRSGRMARNLLIQVSGTDANGKSFISRAKTRLLSRYGAEILLEQPLAPEQEINVTCEGIMTGEGGEVDVDVALRERIQHHHRHPPPTARPISPGYCVVVNACQA